MKDQLLYRWYNKRRLKIKWHISSVGHDHYVSNRKVIVKNGLRKTILIKNLEVLGCGVEALGRNHFFTRDLSVSIVKNS